MTTDEVLNLFQQKAEELGDIKDTQNEIILTLAQVIANCKDMLTQKSYDELLHIGAVMYQEGLSQYKARTEVAGIMKESSSHRKSH